MAKKTPARLVRERLALAEREAARGNVQAAANYARAAANIQGSGQARVQQVAAQYAAAANPPRDSLPIGDIYGPYADGGEGKDRSIVPEPERDRDRDRTPTPAPTVTGVYQKRVMGGFLVTVERMSDGSEREINRERSMGAGDSAAEMFRNAGLNPEFVDQLMATINGVYAANLDPSQGQILNVIYDSQAYKDRFKANYVIRQRLGSGQPRPGDRMLSPKEYIDLENTYREIFQSAGMPEGYYDNPDDFVTLISNAISPTEVQSRVRVAGDALNRADQSILRSLNQYYNVSREDLVAYLLDPAKAMPILEGRQTAGAFGMNRADELERMYRVSEVGGSADRQGLDTGRGMSEEIVDLGKADQADSAFQMAGAADQDLRRLGSLYEQPLDFKDMVKESLNLTGGVESGRKRRKLASKERAAFGGQGALDRTSLRKMQDV